MAARLPIVLGADGLFQQLQAGDTTPGGATAGSNSNGAWRKLADGTLLQSGTVTLSSGAAAITFPIPFPTGCSFVGLTPIVSSTAAGVSCTLAAAPTTTGASVRGTTTTTGATGAVTAGTFQVAWFAIGS